MKQVEVGILKISKNKFWDHNSNAEGIHNHRKHRKLVETISARPVNVPKHLDLFYHPDHLTHLLHPHFLEWLLIHRARTYCKSADCKDGGACKNLNAFLNELELENFYYK